MAVLPLSQSVDSIEEFITRIKSDYESWNTGNYPWFRGEPESPTPLLPKLYRPLDDQSYHDENQLLQRFRMRAPTLSERPVPLRSGHTDEWLFLARHMGLPTRLLDWTEGALIGLYFPLMQAEPKPDRSKKPIVWMLNPVQLNRMSLPGYKDNEFPLTWVRGSIANENIRGAWENDVPGLPLPVAVLPTNIHPRMAAQRSSLTIHGKRKQSLNHLVGPECLRGYIINPACYQGLLRDLRLLGIAESSLFPDLEGLANELEQFF